MDYDQESLKLEVELAVLNASATLTALEQLDNKSEDYIRGFLKGCEHHRLYCVAVREICLKTLQPSWELESDD